MIGGVEYSTKSNFTSKRRFLDERLGGPAAQKCYGEGVEGEGVSQEKDLGKEERNDIRVKDLWEVNRSLGEGLRRTDHTPGEGETEYYTSVSIEGRLSKEEEEAYRRFAEKMGCENMTSDGWVHEYQFPYMHAGADVFVGEAEADLVRRMGVSPETVLVEKERKMEEKQAESQEKERKEETKKETPEEERKRQEEEQKKVERIELVEGALILKGMEKAKAIEEIGRIEKALEGEHGIDPRTKDGKEILRKLLDGEKVTVGSDDGNISYDIAVAKGKEGIVILTGNLTVKDSEKLSQEEKEIEARTAGRHLSHYMDSKERIGWAVVTEDNIPDQIKGHSVTTQEKQAMLRGESIVIDGCTEGSKEPYSAEVHMNLEKRGEKIKPVMSVKPKKEERQSQKQQQPKAKASQSQRQGMRQ